MKKAYKILTCCMCAMLFLVVVATACFVMRGDDTVCIEYGGHYNYANMECEK